MKKVFFMFWSFVQPVTVFSKVKRESVHRSVTDVPAPYTASEAERGSAPQTFTEELCVSGIAFSEMPVWQHVARLQMLSV